MDGEVLLVKERNWGKNNETGGGVALLHWGSIVHNLKSGRGKGGRET